MVRQTFRRVLSALVIAIALAVGFTVPPVAQVYAQTRALTTTGVVYIRQITSGALTFATGTVLKLADGTTAAPSATFTSNTGDGLSHTSGTLRINLNGAEVVRFSSTDVWGDTDSSVFRLGLAGDVNLARDAANILALRNGTNQQTLRVYNTTDGSGNTEYGASTWVGNRFTIGVTGSTGTGTARASDVYADRLRANTGSIAIAPTGTTIWTFNTVTGDLQGASSAVSVTGGQRVTADVTNATASMSNIADLSHTVGAGTHYTGEIQILAKNSTAAEGLQFDLNGGTATFTDIEYGFAGAASGATLGVTTSTAAGTAITATTVSTSDQVYTIAFSFTVNAAGTVIPRFAEVSHTSGTATVRKNGAMQIFNTTN